MTLMCTTKLVKEMCVQMVSRSWTMCVKLFPLMKLMRWWKLNCEMSESDCMLFFIMVYIFMHISVLR